MLVPQRDRELPVEVLNEVGAVLFVEVDDDLGVRVRVEAVSRLLQLGAQLDVVENFAIEDDPHRLILVVDRLVATRQVDDAQAGVRQADVVLAEKARAVRPAVVQLRDHPRQFAARRRSPIGIAQDAGYSAHWLRSRTVGLG